LHTNANFKKHKNFLPNIEFAIKPFIVVSSLGIPNIKETQNTLGDNTVDFQKMHFLFQIRVT
tara:strand:+ start:44600 stop:44785 length:186 start_codon:yes stop_codon:yes gene_type:complete